MLGMFIKLIVWWTVCLLAWAITFVIVWEIAGLFFPNQLIFFTQRFWIFVGIGGSFVYCLVAMRNWRRGKPHPLSLHFVIGLLAVCVMLMSLDDIFPKAYDNPLLTLAGLAAMAWYSYDRRKLANVLQQDG